MKVQHQQPQSFYVAAGLYNMYDGNVRTLNDNKMVVGRSRGRTPPSYRPYDQSQRKECNKEMVSKPSTHTSWWNDSEAKRKRRVAKYKLYAAEGKLKSSLKKGFRTLKIACAKVVTGL